MKNAAFLLLSVGMVGCSGEVSSNKTKAQQYVDSNRITASVMAQDFVQSELRSPSTASTGWQVATNTTFWVGEKEWISVFWMDATNGFGATVREGFVVMVTDHGDTWRLVGIKRLDHKQVQDEQLLARALERDAIAAANGLEQATVAAETEVKQPIDRLIHGFGENQPILAISVIKCLQFSVWLLLTYHMTHLPNCLPLRLDMGRGHDWLLRTYAGTVISWPSI